MSIEPQKILEALRAVQDPDLHKDIVTLGFVKNLTIDNRKVSFDVELTTPACPVKDELKRQAEGVVSALDGVDEVAINMTAQVRPSQADNKEALIPLIKNTIAIASGKGGVGKSTVSTNLTLALAATGAKVGLFDADIYGPNIPQMIGIDVPPRQEGNKMIPARSHDIPVMSMSFLLKEDQPVIWRGPMLHGAIRQFLGEVAWGELDYLMIDLPPGTGDVQLSLCQLIPLTGAVIVTTPQMISLADVRKGVAMLKQLKVPILGVIENMGAFHCPNCDHETALFPGKGGEELARELKVSFLGRLPFDPQVAQGGDEGKPIVIEKPDHPVSVAFKKAAGVLAQEIAKQTFAKNEGHQKLGQIRL